MGTLIVVAVLVCVVLFAFRGSLGHLKGEGGCCGGGGDQIRAEEKALENPILGRKLIRIEGMHCDNCKNSIERRINKIEGAACKVDRKKKLAVISYDRELKEEELRMAIELLDFQVISITDEKV